jgi:Methyltransferase domain
MIQKITSDSKVVVVAEREIAYDSPDHLMPWGTRADNSRNPRFNQKLYYLFPKRENLMTVLDLGCSGGGFVKECFDNGCLAVGLEGSDYSKKHRRAEWATIPEFLFTADITKNVDVFLQNGADRERMQFDVVTSWEVMEHIKTEDLPTLIANMKKHLKPSGLWIMSVSPNVEVVNGVTLHQTVQPKKWWIDMFAQAGLTHLPKFDEYFHTQYVRGPKYGAPDSFHLVLSLDPAKAPKIPPQGTSWKSKLYDSWLGSKYQKLLRRWVVGI